MLQVEVSDAEWDGEQEEVGEEQAGTSTDPPPAKRKCLPTKVVKKKREVGEMLSDFIRHSQRRDEELAREVGNT